MKLLKCNIADIGSEEIEKRFSELPENIKAHISKKKSERERSLSTVGYSLAAKEGGEIGILPSGKPHFKNSPLFFSISHSENVVAVAISEREVGVDVEKLRNVRKGVANRFFTGSEAEYAGSDAERFFEIWTKKEAYAKAKGGMIYAIDCNMLEKEFYTEDFDGYKIAVYEE